MFYTQEHNIINNREIWHYLIDTPIGKFHIIEYETQSKELSRFIIDGDDKKAEQKFLSICKGILTGKM